MKTINTEFDWSQFSIGFWHPFGPHGGETPKQILARKAEEINNNGWTLWSFDSRRTDPEASLLRWTNAIATTMPGKVFAFCSNGKSDKDDVEQNDEPISEKSDAASYRYPGSNNWSPVPASIEIPHHFGSKDYALAFKVNQIHIVHRPAEQPHIPVEWQEKSGLWRSDRLAGGFYYPTHGQPLLRLTSESQAKLRPVRAVLELEAPYVAAIRK